MTTFNNTLAPWTQIIKNHLKLLKLKPILRDIFQASVMFVYYWLKIFKNDKKQNLKQENYPKQTNYKTIKFCQTYNGKKLILLQTYQTLGVSGKLISFPNLITSKILVQMISDFNSMSRNNSKFYFVFFSFLV